MARTLIAYFWLLCLLEVCIFQGNVPRYYPAYFKPKSNLRQQTENPKKNTKASGNDTSYGLVTDKTDVIYDHCICSRIYDPICASNHKSYFNICQFECELGKSTNVTVIHQGNCIPF